MRIVRLFQHQHGHAGKPQFAGEEQADRAGAGDDDVMGEG
jgi:hypothetical protein